MSNGENRRNGPEFRTAPLITSATMVGVGTLIALTGLAFGFQHLVSATRQWVNEMEVPPRELARLKWDPGQGGDGGRDVGLAERDAARSLATGPGDAVADRVARGTRADFRSLMFHPSRVGRDGGVTDGLGAT